MKKIKLEAEKRKIFGKKVKKLRKEGILPANIYGRQVKSSAVQVPFKDFQKVYHEAGETGLVELQVTGEEKVRPVLLHNLQFDPVSHAPLHVDFYQVDLKEKITAPVPVVTVGESPAVAEKKGLLLTIINEIEVEALPTDLPENIPVDIGKLAEVDQEIKVSDLKVPSAVKILTDPSLVAVKIGPLVTAEMEAEIKKEEEEKAATEAAKAEEVAKEAEAAPAAEAKPEPEKPEEDKTSGPS